jgi:hypothetical protein
MSEMNNEVRDAQFAYVAAYVRLLDPSATDAAITRYLVEIETMTAALRTLEIPATTHIESFTPEWPDGASA